MNIYRTEPSSSIMNVQNPAEFHRSLFPTDPLEWNRNDVIKWLQWTASEFSLDHFSPEAIDLSGRQLARMDKNSFCRLFPEHVGDILWQHLSFLVRQSLAVTRAEHSDPSERPFSHDEFHPWDFPYIETSCVRSRSETVQARSLPWIDACVSPMSFIDQPYQSCHNYPPSSDDSCGSLSYDSSSIYDRQRHYHKLPSCMYETTSPCSREAIPNVNNNINSRSSTSLNTRNNYNDDKNSYNNSSNSIDDIDGASSSRSGCDAGNKKAVVVCRSLGQGPIQLWEFLLELLVDPGLSDVIAWTGDGWEFKLINPEAVAELWGRKKCKPKMNYEKLSRGLRYYYEKRIIVKTAGKRYVYRFVCDMKRLVHCDSPLELYVRHQSRSQRTRSPFYGFCC